MGVHDCAHNSKEESWLASGREQLRSPSASVTVQAAQIRCVGCETREWEGSACPCFQKGHFLSKETSITQGVPGR